MSILALPDGVAAADVALCALGAFFASIVGGLAGYGAGLLMPLFLIPVIGPEPVIPLIGVTALFTNAGRIVAFRKFVDWPKVARVLVLAIPGAVLGAAFYASLSGRGVLVLLGATLLAIVPARRWLARRNWRLGEAGLAPAGAIYGVLAGGTNSSGVLLISLLMATGIPGSSVIATDAAISFTIGLVKSGSFAALGALSPGIALFAVIVGFATFPGGFVARFLITRLSVRLHAALLEGAVIVGALGLLWRAFQG